MFQFRSIQFIIIYIRYSKKAAIVDRLYNAIKATLSILYQWLKLFQFFMVLYFRSIILFRLNYVNIRTLAPLDDAAQQYR